MTRNEGAALPSATRPGDGPDVLQQAELSEVSEEQNGGQGAGLDADGERGESRLLSGLSRSRRRRAGLSRAEPSRATGPWPGRCRAGAGCALCPPPGLPGCAQHRAPQLRPSRPERQQQVGPAARRGRRGTLRPGVRGGSWGRRGRGGGGGGGSELGAAGGRWRGAWASGGGSRLFEARRGSHGCSRAGVSM